MSISRDCGCVSGASEQQLHQKLVDDVVGRERERTRSISLPPLPPLPPLPLLPLLPPLPRGRVIDWQSTTLYVNHVRCFRATGPQLLLAFRTVYAPFSRLQFPSIFKRLVLFWLSFDAPISRRLPPGFW